MPTKLTEAEALMIVRIAEDEYGDEPGDTRWFEIICENLEDSRIVGDLIKMGLVNANRSGHPKDWTINLTAEGCEEYRQLKRDEHYQRTVFGG